MAHRHEQILRTLLTISAVVLATAGAPSEVNAATISGTVTSSDGKPVAKAVVFVQSPVPESAGHKPPPQLVDQIDKTFVPELLPVVVGTLVRFPNHDQIHHHVYSFSPAKTFELPLYKGEDAKPVLFDKVGVVKLGCNIHDWMSGIVLVLPTSWFAETNDLGQFELTDLPAGTYTLAAWHALSKLKPEETEKSIQLRGDASDVAFTLPLSPARPRRAMHGARGEP